MESTERKIIFYGSHFIDFYLGQSVRVQEKIEYVLNVIKQVGKISRKFLCQIEDTDGLYEIRVEYSSNIYRIFCCFDQENIVVLFNGFQKKSRKTPKSEIEKASRLKKEYFNSLDNEKRRNKKSQII
ncbi:MAG: type II toxin-antitoxin system RelE/ParE family toxin [Bacteroidales bacterium]|nr:type II toxin-antitoxin system RelE/ParE family toxin [Bacteroidales bacterium]